MKKYLLSAFALLPLGIAMAQEEPPHEPIPVLRQRLATARNDTARLGLQLTLADAYIEDHEEDSHNLDTAEFFLAEVGKAAPTHADRRLQGLYHRTYGRTLDAKANHDSAIQQTLLAINLLQPNTFDWAKACVLLSFIYSPYDPHQDSIRCIWFEKAMTVFAAFNTRESKEWYAYTLLYYAQSERFKPAEALAMYFKALDIWRSVSYKEYRDLYAHISAAYAQMGNQAQALQYALLTLRQDELRPKPDKLSVNVYNGVGYCYGQQGNYREALPYFQKALALAIRLGDTSKIIILAGSIVSCSIVTDNYSEALLAKHQASAAYPPQSVEAQVRDAEDFAYIFMQAKQMDSMRFYVDRLLKLGTAIPPNTFFRYHVLTEPTFYFNNTGQYAQAKKYATEIIRIAKLFGSIEAAIAGYYELSRADSGLGNYKDAMDEYKKYVKVKDSIEDVDNTKQVASLKVQYETEIKDKNILALNHRQELSQLALHQAGLTRNFIIAGAALLLLLLLVAINRYRLKQRTNKKLELQQREIAKKNDSLHQLVNEKDWLLKEIHHRVKNNLQIVMSLLNSQSAFIDNEPALTAIHDSQHRVYAISLIHQKLYNSENVASIDLSFYIRELVSYLRDSFDAGQRISFALDIQPITVDVGQAVPLGLILNEAITNAIKYAFPDGRTGVITLSLVQSAPRHCLLVIADDGIGIPEGIDIKKNGSLGMTLMQGLSANLNGSFSIGNHNGTVIKITFVVDPVVITTGILSSTSDTFSKTLVQTY